MSFHLQWHITERCNLSCTHCYRNPKFIKEELSTKDFLNILNKYYDQLDRWGFDNNKNSISFTGGEPFIREDFWEILENCYQHKEKIHYGILTNGTFLNDEVVSNLKNLGVSYVQVSLEGLKNINDQIRGIGSFEKAVFGLKSLVKQKNIVSVISTTITKKNLAEVPKMISLAKEIGVNGIGFRRLVPIGMGEQMKELIITPKQTEELFKYVKKNNTGNFHVGVGCEEGLLAQENYKNNHICNAGYFSFTVMPNADVYPCRRLPILSGNLLKSDFDDIMKESKELRQIRDLNNINQKCQSCPYFNECLGGAKCIANAYFGDPFAPDPQCWRLFQKLPNHNMKFEKNNKNKYRGFEFKKNE